MSVLFPVLSHVFRTTCVQYIRSTHVQEFFGLHFGQDSFEEFPFGSDASLDDETFEALMGIHDATSEEPEVETFVSNPSDPNTFETVPYEPGAVGEELEPVPVALEVEDGEEKAIDDRIKFLQYSGF